MFFLGLTKRSLRGVFFLSFFLANHFVGLVVDDFGNPSIIF